MRQNIGTFKEREREGGGGRERGREREGDGGENRKSEKKLKHLIMA